MNINELNNLIKNVGILEERINKYKEKKLIKMQNRDEAEINGHLEKAEHNLRFIHDNLILGHLDWCITGAYYSVYHATLALILNKNYSSKNHEATLCILIKEYYKNGVSKEDIELINNLFIDYQDLLFYIQSKDKRNESTYSSKYKFDKQTVEDLRSKAILFVNKAKGILKN